MAMWFVCDGCGIVCFCFAYGMLSSANFVVLKLGWWPWGPTGTNVCLAIYETWFVLAIWSHLTCMLTDPGAVPLDTELTEGMKQCSKCNAPKPARAHHCSVCRRCIMKMDHHCPWVNNCIGARNQKHFVLFLLYVQLQCWSAVGCLGARFLGGGGLDAADRPKGFLARDSTAAREAWRAEMRRRAAERTISDGDMVCCILIFFIAIIFGLFTCIMLCDQLSNICSNTTGIEAMQSYSAKQRPWRESIQEVMGRGPVWRWLLPTPWGRTQIKDVA